MAFRSTRWRLDHKMMRADSSALGDFCGGIGGTVTTIGNYRIHTFTSTGTFTLSSIGRKYPELEVLVVAGGGGGEVRRKNARPFTGTVTE